MKFQRRHKRRKGNVQGSATVLPNVLLGLLDENPQKRYSVNQIAKYFKIRGSKPKRNLKDLLETLALQGSIRRISSKYYQSMKPPVRLVGKIDHVNPNFGYVVCADLEEDVWISSRRLRGAMHGDEVEFVVYERGRQEAEVRRILQRKNGEMVGTITLSARYAFFVPASRKIYTDVFIGRADTLDAANGDRVIVRITDWMADDEGSRPEGKVVRVLGKAGENDAEMHAIMFEFGLPFDFPKAVEEEASRISAQIPAAEIAKRKDFRQVETFTIDPETAKDFDDAISLRKTKGGKWEVGVHIADVTHYVLPGSKLEAEAYARGSSVYLVDRTVPMLPEKLSNNLCSLRPNEDKLCFSAVFELDDNGNLSRRWFGRTVINSDCRFTYAQAQEAIESGEGTHAQALSTLNGLAAALKTARFNQGALAFELPEFYFRLDAQGKPLELRQKIRQEAHKLVEEFMLLANREVATFVYGHKKDNSPTPRTMVYRTHDLPDQERLARFSLFAKRLGYRVTTDRKQLAKSLNRLAETAAGKPERHILESQAIRTMSKAKYTTEPLGHYGLAFTHYTHFTSPIRRYPDMMAHRLLQHYLNKKASPDAPPYEAQCKHASDMEKRAADAERASVRYKQVEFMQQYLDKTMEGFVSGMNDRGMFVELLETHCEGMVRLASIPGDYYYHDEENMQIVGRRTGNTYTIGHHLAVKIVGTSLDKRTIDMELVR